MCEEMEVVKGSQDDDDCFFEEKTTGSVYIGTQDSESVGSFFGVLLCPPCGVQLHQAAGMLRLNGLIRDVPRRYLVARYSP